MTRNPVLNALTAVAYIFIVALFMSQAEALLDPVPILAPVIFLSLFVFSAATMGYLFLGQPVQMYLDGAKKEAVDFFLKTLLTFGVCLIGILIIALLLA